MTPKEKAKELVDKYQNFIIEYTADMKIHKLAKQSALIAVDELIYSVHNEHFSDIFNQFWAEVEQELLKL